MKINLKKLTAAGMMAAIGVCLSAFSIPVGASKCFPIQHLLNVLAGVFLGPGYAAGFAFSASLIRNLMGTGTLLAFPGSMAGAFLCAVLYRKQGKCGQLLQGNWQAPESLGASFAILWQSCFWEIRKRLFLLMCSHFPSARQGAALWRQCF